VKIKYIENVQYTKNMHCKSRVYVVDEIIKKCTEHNHVAAKIEAKKNDFNFKVNSL
jgi:hypothetical protein